jgi:hypothetical protein
MATLLSPDDWRDMTNPLALLGTDKLYLAKQENTRVAPQRWELLYDDSGPGVVKSIWMALGGGNNCTLDGRLQVFYDAKPAPDIDIDFGTLLAVHWGASGSLSTDNVHVEINPTNYNMGLLLTFPMPFGAHISVRYFNPAPLGGQLAWVYSMVTFAKTATDEANGQRLRCQGKRWMDQPVLRAAADATKFAAISGGPGSVVWHSQVGGIGANNQSWLERNMAFYLDGEPNPSIQATGTEDWFDSAWYFNGWKDYSTSRHSFVGTGLPAAQPNCFGMATDLLGKWGGVPFNSACQFFAFSEPACITGDYLCWTVLYYQ